MKNKDLSAKGFLEYMNKVVKEFKTAEIAAMSADAKSFAVYKCLSELPAQMRQKVVSTMTREMTFEELKAELQKLASLKTMEDAIGGKPKVTKMVQEQQQQERRSRPGWPAGLDPAQFGCLKCGSKDGHNARSCQVDRKDLACNFCGRQQSHVEAVCFKKLESEGKLAPRQQQQQQPQQQQQQTAARHPSPAGGPRSQTPGPQKLNALKLRRQSKRPLASLGGKSSEVKETREGGRLQQQQSTDEAEEQQPSLYTNKKSTRHHRAADELLVKPRLCTIRLKKEADGLPRRQVSVWRKRRRGVEEEASQVASLCDSGSSAAVASKQMVDSLKAEVRMYTHDSIRLASTSREELPIVGVTELWIKLKESDRYKRKIEALVVDGIDEHLILGVE